MPVLPAYTHNGENIAADAFYAIACDPRRSVAVEACAGAGKTWMLVSRMVRALLDGQTQPHEILAITFTKKAAGEMRERLYEWLAEFAQADDETLQRELVSRGVMHENGGQPNEIERKQLSNLYHQILAQGRQVQIKTFHGWFASLLRSAPMATLQQLGLPLDYELLEDDGPARALVWRRFYGALLDLPELKADFELIVQAHGRFQTDKALQGILSKRSEFMLADAAGVVDTSVQHFSAMYPEFAAFAHPEQALFAGPVHELLLAAAQALARASASSYSAKGVELELALSQRQANAALLALLTDKGAARKFSDKIAGIATVRQAQETVLHIAAAINQHVAWDYHQRMARLARVLLAEFAALKRDSGWVDMNDVERAAQLMLTDPVLSGWVQERLDARVRHLMIDEFQDTNPLQWQALSSWLSGYGGAGGSTPSVFMVGDPKQSIYRFRRAEPQVFIAALAFMRTALGGDVLACDHTRRSSQAVTQCVNSAIAEAAANHEFEGFRPHTTSSAQKGRVLRLPVVLRLEKSQTDGKSERRDNLTMPRELPEETLKTLEARQAAAWIQNQIAGGIKPNEVMALSRKRSSLMPLQSELRALHVPVQIGEKTALIDCCEVQDIVALLDVLVSPGHDLSLARALRSPLFSVSTDSLVEIVLAVGSGGQSWYEVLLKDKLLAQDLCGLGAILASYRTLLDTLPPHDALQAIYDTGDVLARFAAAAPAARRSTVVSNLQSLLTAALQVDGGRYSTPYAIVRALKAGGLQAPAAIDPDAVRLLTVHGAKGLEAHTVLLLDTDTAPRNADSMSVLIDWPGQAAAPQKFVFLISENLAPACALGTLAAEQAARQREELNALYVAVTRAKHTLAVSSIEPYRTPVQSWWQRLHGLADAQSVTPAINGDELADAGTFTLPDLPNLPDLPGFTNTRDPASFVNAETDVPSARLGNAMHRLLQWQDISDLAAGCAALEFGLTADQAAQAQAMASRIRHGAGSWAWDEPAIAWQGDEVELVHQGLTLRLDRLVQRRDADHAGQWWILDYKTALSPQKQTALVAKMKIYISALQAIEAGQTIKAAFLTSDGKLVMVD